MPKRSPHDIRLSSGVAIELAAANPAALALLCRVMWRCRGEQRECFAALDTLRADGTELSESGARRALGWLVSEGYFTRADLDRRKTPTYRPTAKLPAKPWDSVFVPQEVWRTCEPLEIAYWCVRTALGKGCSSRCKARVEEVAARIKGERGMLGRASAFRIHGDLVRKGLLLLAPKVATWRLERLASGGSAAVSVRSDESHNGGSTSLTAAVQPVSQSTPKYGLGESGDLNPEIRDHASTDSDHRARCQPSLRVVSPELKPLPDSPSAPLLHVAFAELVAKAGAALGLRCPVRTATHLPAAEERLIAEQWQVLLDDAKCDLGLVGEWIAAGGLAWYRGAAWKYLARNLAECIGLAREWAESGRRLRGRSEAGGQYAEQYRAEARETDEAANDPEYIRRVRELARRKAQEGNHGSGSNADHE